MSDKYDEIAGEILIAQGTHDFLIGRGAPETRFPTLEKKIADALRKAVADEREECAKVALTRHVRWHLGGTNVECDVTACEDIAAAIRSRTESTP